MPGDFDERLAAVDDALDDATSGGGGRDWDAEHADATPADAEGAGGMPADADADAVAADVTALTDRVAELEAAVQALRGYAGSVRAVNDRVEERADAAVATAEDLRERVTALERRAASRDSGGARARDGGPVANEASRGGVDDRSSRAREASNTPREDTEDHGRVESSRARSSDESGPVAWPPAEPRAPYGEPDADDDTEQPGLVARLRDAL